MKKLITTIAIMLFSVIIFAQSEKATEMLNSIKGQYELDDNGNVTFTRVVSLIDTLTNDTISKDEIYNRAYSYFVYNYVSGESVIQLSDKPSGVIVAKGIYANVHSDMSLVVRVLDAYHILRIDIKDGKARIILSLTQYKYTVSDGKGLPSISNMFIAQTYPFNEKGTFKTFMGKGFVKTYEKAMSTMDALEKALKEGNTSKKIENSGW